MRAKVDRVVAVVGPTCAGKSELALHIAEEVNGEIINADSMQVYRQFDIGTAKPDMVARSRVTHHLIDVADPAEEFNAAVFRELAEAAIKAVQEKGRVPITVGGTGLYLRILFHGLFPVKKDTLVRRELREAFAVDARGLYEELKKIDPRYALKISHRDGVRVVRALEVYRLTGVTMSRWQEDHGFSEQRHKVYKIGLTGPREELYRRIDRRVDDMLRQGWVDEVKGLLQRYGASAKPFSAIGYREILLYLGGAIREEEMVREIKKNTRRYAKRQMTWFAREPGIEWFTYPEDREIILEKVGGFLCLN